MTDILQRWAIAQQEERKHHSGTLEAGVEAYKESYAQYFKYLETTNDQTGKKIIEIGCADVPALMFCNGYKPSFIIEPLPSPILLELTKDLAITILVDAAENLDFPKVDEVWLFNVLQHVIDPDVIINKCKEAAKVIRFFEPVEDHIDLCHLHTFSLDYFKGHFGDCVQYYEDHKGRVKNFHEHEAAYGVWVK